MPLLKGFIGGGVIAPFKLLYVGARTFIGTVARDDTLSTGGTAGCGGMGALTLTNCE
jgi:hypothetical protein